jgi:hypothetical protein
MKLARYLSSRGLTKEVINELLPYIPRGKNEHVFFGAAAIMNPDKWFFWPGQTRFIPVGQCPNGDAVAIDSEKEPGAVFYIAHELTGSDRPPEEVVVLVAKSPSEFIQRFVDEPNFPYDYWEARSRNTEPGASPNRRPARQRAGRAARCGGGR